MVQRWWEIGVCDSQLSIYLCPELPVVIHRHCLLRDCEMLGSTATEWSIP